MLLLLGDSTPAIVGVFMLKEPKEIWVNDPPAVMSVDGVSPAVMATILFMTLFLYFLVLVSQTILEIRAPSQLITKLVGTLVFAGYMVNFAPMIATLFIRSRVRALQIGPEHGSPAGSWCWLLHPVSAAWACEHRLERGNVNLV